MGRIFNQKQLFFVCSCSQFECTFGHVIGVGLAASHHQQGLIDQRHAVVCIESHQVDQASGGIPEGRIGVCMGAVVIIMTFAIQVKRHLISHLIGCFGISHVAHFSTGSFEGTGIRSLFQPFLNRLQL